MALPSKQITPTHVLDSYLARMVSRGYSVGENPRYGTKRVTKGVHRADSFHYAGLAADINYGGNGANERAKLIEALNEAVALGLSVTFARDGRVGSAANHVNHLHVDTGEWSNFGKGLVRTVAKPASSASGIKWLGHDRGVLVLGSQGDRVRNLQRVLNANYPSYSKLKLDGDYGNSVADVVEEFQKRSGLKADREAGPATFGKLGLAW